MIAGAELPDAARSPGDETPAGEAATDAGETAAGAQHGPDDGGRPVIDAEAQTAHGGAPGIEDTAIIASGGRRRD